MTTLTPMLSMLLALFGLLGVFWLLSRGVARMPGLRKLLPRSAGRVLTSVAVGPRERVVVVALGGETLALGVAPGRVNLLAKLDPDTARELEPPAPSSEAAKSVGLRS